MLKFICKYKYEFLFIGIILFMLLISIFKKTKGTWSDTMSIKEYLIFNKSQEGRSLNARKVDAMPNTKRDYKRRKYSKGESECRRVLEEYFNKPFPSCRPNMLRNPVTGNRHNLEIDCYNDELKLGVEYNGIQHYEYSSYFHKNKEAFMNQKYRDELKCRMCKDLGIRLITVPYSVKEKDIKRYLLNIL